MIPCCYHVILVSSATIVSEQTQHRETNDVDLSQERDLSLSFLRSSGYTPTTRRPTSPPQSSAPATPAPTHKPSIAPTKSPSTNSPTSSPTLHPTSFPTRKPSLEPTDAPISNKPTNKPSRNPTAKPTRSPVSAPNSARARSIPEFAVEIKSQIEVHGSCEEGIVTIAGIVETDYEGTSVGYCTCTDSLYSDYSKSAHCKQTIAISSENSGDKDGNIAIEYRILDTGRGFSARYRSTGAVVGGTGDFVGATGQVFVSSVYQEGAGYKSTGMDFFDDLISFEFIFFPMRY